MLCCTNDIPGPWSTHCEGRRYRAEMARFNALPCDDYSLPLLIFRLGSYLFETVCFSALFTLSSFLPSHVFHNRLQVTMTSMQHTTYLYAPSTTSSLNYFESLIIYPDSGGPSRKGSGLLTFLHL